MIQYEDGNFWELHPSLKLKLPFRDIYKKYKATKKSSNMAWYVWLFCDSNSEFFTYPEEVRHEELAITYGDLKSVPEVSNAIVIYNDHMCDSDERAFKQWAKKLQERANYLESIKYEDVDLDQIKKIDDMLIGSNKIWDAFNKVKETYIKSKAENTIMGGGSETFLEQS